MTERSHLWFALVLVALLAACGCRGAASDEATPEAATPVLAVSVAPVAVAPMQKTLRLLGATAAMHHVILRAPVAGRVLGIKLAVGDTVHKGETVAHVLSREIEAAREGLAVAKKIDPQDAANLEKSVRKYDRGGGIPVVAADGGVVSAPPVTNGQLVGYLDPIADLIDPRSIYVNAAVPAEDLHLISVGMPVTVKSPLKPAAAMTARVAAILPDFNAGSATSPARIEFTGADRLLIAEAPVEAIIIIQSIPDALVIPTAALFQDEDGAFHVFVAGKDGRAHRTPIALGIRDPQQVQVISGLSKGDLVVTSGGYALSDGLRISVAQASSSQP